MTGASRAARFAQIPAITTCLSPATRRMSPGSLLTTEIRSADADSMTAPMCASATETLVRSRIGAAALA